MDRPKALAEQVEDLGRENAALRLELETLRREQRAVWSMLADAGRRLQVSAAAIKAAVSSLLDHDIFWDISNQHEFLETIDTSADQVGRQIRLLALTFQSQAGRLELRREPNVLPEILSALESQQAALYPRLPLEVLLPSAGRPVLADDEHLTLALQLLLEVFSGRVEHPPLRVRVAEEPAGWRLTLTGLQPAAAALVPAQMAERPEPAEGLPAESQLRLLVACRLLGLHGVEAWVSAGDELNLRLPAAMGPAPRAE
jgi:hypothetical protein